MVRKITTFVSSIQSSELSTLLPIQDFTIVCVYSPELLAFQSHFKTLIFASKYSKGTLSSGFCYKEQKINVSILKFYNNKPKNNTLARTAQPKLIQLRNALSLLHNGIQSTQQQLQTHSCAFNYTFHYCYFGIF